MSFPQKATIGLHFAKNSTIKDSFNFDQLHPYESVCDYYLFDTKGKLPGGNGYAFNWWVRIRFDTVKLVYAWVWAQYGGEYVKMSNGK